MKFKIDETHVDHADTISSFLNHLKKMNQYYTIKYRMFACSKDKMLEDFDII